MTCFLIGLCESYSWLAWLCKIPKPVLGLLQGVLPPVLLAVLMALLPIVLRCKSTLGISFNIVLIASPFSVGSL